MASWRKVEPGFGQSSVVIEELDDNGKVVDRWVEGTTLGGGATTYTNDRGDVAYLERSWTGATILKRPDGTESVMGTTLSGAARFTDEHGKNVETKQSTFGSVTYEGEGAFLGSQKAAAAAKKAAGARSVMGSGSSRAAPAHRAEEGALGPLESFRSLFTTLRRAKLPAHAAGFDDQDYATAVSEVAARSEEERASWRAAVRTDLAEVIDSTIEDAGEQTRLKGLLATMPDEMLDHVSALVEAVDRGTQRRGAPSFFATDGVTPELLARADAAAESQIQDIVLRGSAMASAQRGNVVVPGFTRLFGAGIHVFRAFAFFLFWLASRVGAGIAIIWIPIWILAAAADFVTFSLPWVFFALTARYVRGDNAGDRARDRLYGCWCFGTSKQARLDHVRLRRFRSHRVFVDLGLLSAVPAVLAIRSAALSEVSGTRPTPPSPIAGVAPVRGGEHVRWWAPRGAAALYFVGLICFLTLSGSSDGGKQFAVKHAADPVESTELAKPAAAAEPALAEVKSAEMPSAGAGSGDVPAAGSADGANADPPPDNPARATPKAMLEAERAALGKGDFAAIGAMFSAQGFGFGVEATEMAIGWPAIEAQLRHDLGTPPADGFTITAQQRTIGEEGDAAWTSERLVVSTSDGAPPRELVVSQFLRMENAPYNGDWSIVAWHWSVAVPARLAHERAIAGTLPVPVAIKTSSKTLDPGSVPLLPVARKTFGSLDRLRSTLSDRPEAVNIGTAPGERIVGGDRIRKVFAKSSATLRLRNGVHVYALPPAITEDMSAREGVSAATVDFTVDDNGTSVTVPMRLLAVWWKGPKGWQIVQAHWSIGGPLSADATSPTPPVAGAVADEAAAGSGAADSGAVAPAGAAGSAAEAATPKPTPTATPMPAPMSVSMTSTCKDSVSRAGDQLRLAKGWCFYRADSALPAGSTMTFSARMASGDGYGFWLGSWSAGKVDALGVQYESGGIKHVRYPDTESDAAPRTRLTTDREPHRWRVERTGKHVKVSIDGTVVIDRDLTAAGNEFGFRTWRGDVEISELRIEGR